MSCVGGLAVSSELERIGSGGSGGNAGSAKRSWVSVPQNVWILGIYKIVGAILGSVFRCALILGSFQPDAWDLGMNFLVGGF